VTRVDSQALHDEAADARRPATLPSVKGSAPSHGEALEIRDLPAPTDLGALAAGADRLVHGGEIARGGMASIGIAFDQALLRRVAVKRVRGQADSVGRQRFCDEARITAQLDHPNVVPVHDLALDPASGEPFFTMKLVEGHTLTQVIDEAHRHELTPERLHPILQILLKVCDAVAFAHSRGLVHRDLKPENVMVGTHGQVYVMDWGVARVLRRDMTLGRSGAWMNEAGFVPRDLDADSIIGTPDYMAPEQALGDARAIDERTDVFGLGGILYYLLTGLGPYSRAGVRASLSQRGEVVPPEDQGVWPRLPPGLCHIAMKALAAEKHERFSNVEELRHCLEEFMSGGGWFATKRFRAGEVIVREGEVGDSAYIISEGQCEVFRMEEGQKQPLRELGPGEVFGETAVLTRKPRTASVAALSDVTLKVVTSTSLENELSRNPWLEAFVRSLAERFREADAEVASHRRARSSNSTPNPE
jgi:serine/threonine-protein kinase